MRRRIAFCLLICLILCGCGNSVGQNSGGPPPFSDTERSAFETRLLDSIRFSTGGDSNYIPLYFRNDSDYDIADFRIVGDITHISLLYYSLIPAGTSVYTSGYLPESELRSGQSYSLIYVIGAYEYCTKGIKLDFQKRDPTEDDPLSLRLFLRTTDGEIPLGPRAPINFVAGTEIEGLKTGRIYSISPELFSYSSHILNLGLSIGGKLPPEGITLAAKLTDENGCIRDTAEVRASYGNADMIELHIGGNLEPGKYCLCFEELKN